MVHRAWTVPTMIALTVFVKFTALGKAMRATAQNPTSGPVWWASTPIASSPRRFAIGGALAGVASVVYGAVHQVRSITRWASRTGYTRSPAARNSAGSANIPGAVLGGPW